MKWTKKELKFLRKNKNKMTCREMGESLGRTRASIEGMMPRYGIKRSRKVAKEFQAENGRRHRKKLEFKDVPCELYPELGDCLVPISHSIIGYAYPRIMRNGRSIRMKNYLWEQRYGKIPSGMCILHKCDNTFCVRIEHLFLGTQADNIADMFKKGRQNGGKSKRKLTDKQVVEIYNSDESNKALAKKYSIHRSNICRIRTGKNYADVIGKIQAA